MTVRINADLGPIAEYMSIGKALEHVMQRSDTKNAMTLAMGLSASTEFGLYVDQMAERNHKTLHHMYEWGQIGEFAGRLWDMILTGSGNKVLTYDFLPSAKPVPVGQEHSGVPGDTRVMNHVFEWKAPLMEHGEEVYIVPWDKVLAFPAGGEMRFTPYPITQSLEGAHTGQFQNIWIEFFGAMAGELLDQEYTMNVEEGTREYMNSRILPAISPSTPTRGITMAPKKNHTGAVLREANKLIGGLIGRFRR